MEVMQLQRMNRVARAVMILFKIQGINVQTRINQCALCNVHSAKPIAVTLNVS